MSVSAWSCAVAVFVPQHSVIVPPAGSVLGGGHAAVDEAGLSRAAENVVPSRDEQQILDDALDGRIGGVERFLTVAIVARDMGLGVAHHDDGSAERGQQHHRHQGDDERHTTLVGEPRVEAGGVRH